MKSQYLFMLLGYPGSGKTFFSEQLAAEIGAVRINADAMRVAAFGTIEAARKFDKETGLLNPIVFNVLDYAAGQVLRSGNSVICDYQHNNKSGRSKSGQVAIDNGATPIIIWLKTPRDIAIRRGSERDERLDQRKHSSEKMTMLVDRTTRVMEAPSEDEQVIRIDGTIPFNDQYVSFQQQLDDIVTSNVPKSHDA